MKIDTIKQLMEEFENSKINKMKIEFEDLKLELEKTNTPTSICQPVEAKAVAVSSVTTEIETPTIVEEAQEIGTAIKAPLVGVFYRSSSPTTKPFVEIGESVTKGQVLCIVEAMKVMNEIKSPLDGVVRSIAVENDALVEFDQVLMTIEG